MEILSLEELDKGLKTKVLGRHAVVLDTVDSTNNEARRLLEEGAPEGLVVIAGEQTGGRGRRRKVWVSEKGCGLWMTFAFRSFLPPEKMQTITLAAGVAVCRAVEDLTGGGTRPVIKWPNDVLAGSRKICGILSEAQPSPQPLPLTPYPPLIRGVCNPAASRQARCARDVAAATGGISSYIIVGVGVNTRKPQNGWGEAEGIAVSLEESAGRIVPRMDLAAALLNNMEYFLDAIQAGGFPAIAEEYRKRMLPAGTEVVIIDGDEHRRGRIEGVEDAGGLLVRLENGEIERIVSGEITLRGVGGYV